MALVTDDDKPFGEVGDLVEALVPIAADLVVAVRDHGPAAIRGVLLRVPDGIRERVINLPGGTMGVLAVVLAAMVDPEARMTGLLGWAEQMIPTAAAREVERLRVAGMRTEAAAVVLAGPVAERQTAGADRMLHIVHGERTA